MSKRWVNDFSDIFDRVGQGQTISPSDLYTSKIKKTKGEKLHNVESSKVRFGKWAFESSSVIPKHLDDLGTKKKWQK